MGLRTDQVSTEQCTEVRGAGLPQTSAFTSHPVFAAVAGYLLAIFSFIPAWVMRPRSYCLPGT